jgi:hypothetical protein
MLLACKGHIEAAHSKQLIVGCGRLRSVLFMIFSIRSIFSMPHAPVEVIIHTLSKRDNSKTIDVYFGCF